MNRELVKTAEQYGRRKRRRSAWKRAVSVLGCIVVFCTTYALILPAITMERETVCGFEEHLHDAQCYVQVLSHVRKQPVCSLEELEIHEHKASCYGEDRKLQCRYADFVVHEHDENCYLEDGSLWCGLPEIEEHTHDWRCYAEPEPTPEPHIHDDACYILQQGELICGQEIVQPHAHGEECYAEHTQLVCAIAESEGHQHAEACFDESGVAVCGQEVSEGHAHGETCSETVRSLVCEMQETEGHQHADACYAWEKVLACGLEEIQEEDEPAEPKLICREIEAILHEHKGGCFDKDGYLVCERTQVLKHAHSEECFEEVEIPVDAEQLNCGMDETEEHAHGPLCYGEWEFVCEKTEHRHVSECMADEEPAGLIPEKDAADDEDYGEDTAETPVEGDVPVGEVPATDSASEDESAGEDAVKTPVEGDVPVGEVPATDSASEDESAGEDTAETPVESDVPVGEVPATDSASESESAGEDAADAAVPDEESSEDKAAGDDAAEEADGSETAPAGGEDVPALPDEDASDDVLNEVSQQTAGVYAVRQIPVDLKTYEGAAISFTLTDTENRELPKDNDGNYIAATDTQYKLSLHIRIPDGIAPGTYTYQLPEGLNVVSGDGTFVLEDGVEVGTWTVAEDGLITFVFDEDVNSRTDIVITAAMGVTFAESENPIAFDGTITVVVEKPQEEVSATVVNKYENKSAETADGKLNWEIEILGGGTSQIPGSTLTDAIDRTESALHHYTEADMEAGIRIEMFHYDENGNMIDADSHCWVVTPESEGMTWTADGWTYAMPAADAKLKCEWCGEEFSIGNGEDWRYYVRYSSTIEETAASGIRVYRNEVEIDGAMSTGRIQKQYGSDTSGKVVKTGNYRADTEGGKYFWEINATIPGINEGETAVYCWYLWDELRVRDAEGNRIGVWTNDLCNAEVTATYTDAAGQTVTLAVPNLDDAGADDPIAWHNSWTKEENGLNCGVQIDLYCRCACTEENCQVWNGSCESESNGFCLCWTFPYDVVFTFAYETDGVEIQNEYGGMGNELRNAVDLGNKQYDDAGRENIVVVDQARVVEPIPGLFRKDLTKDYDGYTASYTITVNEGRLKLTDGSPLTIHDEMTETLVYSSGSLVITTDDGNGVTETLVQDEDFTAVYDSDAHTLDIVLLNPQPVMYTLKYDAALIIPEGTTSGVAYSNSATITLFGRELTVDSEEKIYADINISAKNYKVEIRKTASDTKAALPGARFGMYSENGGLIASGVTDERGNMVFETNVVEGIILREHTPYYIQEIAAPAGYVLDDAKHWFCFCEEKNDDGSYAADCTYESGIEGILRIPGDQIGVFEIENRSTYELPETGGAGTTPYTMGGAALIAAAAFLLLYNHIRCRKEDHISS